MSYIIHSSLLNDTSSIFNKLGSKSLILAMSLKKTIFSFFNIYLSYGLHFMLAIKKFLIFFLVVN